MPKATPPERRECNTKQIEILVKDMHDYYKKTPRHSNILVRYGWHGLLNNWATTVSDVHTGVVYDARVAVADADKDLLLDLALEFCEKMPCKFEHMGGKPVT